MKFALCSLSGLTQHDILTRPHSHGKREAESCPPQKRAAATKPAAPMQCFYLEASPSRVLRDGEGTFAVEMSHFRRRKKIAVAGGAVYI